MKSLAAAILMVAFSVTVASAQDAAPPPPATPQLPNVDPNRLALAQKILEETHNQDNMSAALDTMMPAMLAAFRRQSPNLPEETYKLVEQMLSDEMRKELPQMTIINAQIYANHFTLDELKAIDAFYQTPAGQKIMSETPKIFRETVPFGALWGRQAAQAAMQRVIEQLRAKGVKI
jgi:uncharacterized protein